MWHLSGFCLFKALSNFLVNQSTKYAKKCSEIQIFSFARFTYFPLHYKFFISVLVMQPKQRLLGKVLVYFYLVLWIDINWLCLVFKTVLADKTLANGNDVQLSLEKFAPVMHFVKPPVSIFLQIPWLQSWSITFYITNLNEIKLLSYILSCNKLILILVSSRIWSVLFST